ncbi:V-type ATP synthase subunit D [bacterium]|nr:V-type ATP synthase subunit D [bacterium]
MSNRLNLIVTKSNLLRIQEELAFAREGYDLLEQKREILVIEVTALLDDLRAMQKEVYEGLDQAYRSLEQAYMMLGGVNVERAGLSSLSREEVRLGTRNLMGVAIPVVGFSMGDAPCNRYGFQGTSPSLDTTVQLFSSLLGKLARLAEIEVSLLRLAHELKKTQRRSNALNHIVIPQCKESIKYMENTLEEKEREEFFQLKRVKKNSMR